ncbi:ABC transporter permease [Anaerorhabdus furcosa]|uniref:Oligopeptide transport system permease protein n=1 Tax=Anaerorhabdus furcosa TaxID=118967 RepID=A0A1T4PRP6_9FIRM|nr:ABC transporter permease [Anaerorhabdus furcosa]SJZ94099.1 oligopeptide transport system permease protein [Anaerorhabdus furcosa]
MFKYVLKRIGQMLITLFLIMTILFLLLKITPGSPFSNPKITPTLRAQLEEKYGLDKPILTQYGMYLSNVLQGDLGESIVMIKNYPVKDMVAEPLAITIKLGVISLFVGSAIGIFLGALAALNRNRFWDYFNTIIAVVGVSVPAFVVAMVLLILRQDYFPFIPLIFSKADPIKGVTALDELVSLTLPVVSLSFGVIASISRYMRTELVEVYNTDYILLARAKGLNKRQVFTRHAFRNALVPIITVMGPMVVALMTGSVVVEKFFGVPGLSQLTIKSINVKDTFVTLASELLYSLMFVVTMLIVDLLYGVIDPRIRLSGGDKK